LSLVLDGVHGSLGSPVDGVLEVGVIDELDFWDLLNGWHLESKKSLVLLLSPSGELVVSNLESGLSSVDLLNLSILLGEDLESEHELFFGSIRKSELVQVSNEVLLEESALLVVAQVFHADGVAKEVHLKK